MRAALTSSAAAPTADQIGYTKSLNSEGGYTLPGAGSLTTKGNTQNLFLNWGLHLPDLPQVQVHFSDGDSENSLLGSDENSSAHIKLFGVDVTHRWDGFNFAGGYSHSTANEVIPDLFTESAPMTSEYIVECFQCWRFPQAADAGSVPGHLQPQ